VFAPPEQPEALAAAIRSLADNPTEARDMGARGREWVLAHATREALADRYLDVLDGVARRAPRARGLWLKGLLDRTLAFLGLVVLLPVLALLGVLVAVFLGRPVLFRQERPGLGGRPFRLVKLRTMREGEGPDASRLTRFGRLLRATSLDELPELWNVLRGEMSLVGPRPLLMQYLPRYSARQARRHEMKPGLTGWAQVNGRNQLSWDERLELDVWYVENWSLGLDGRILARTLSQVLRRRGISHPGAETMPEFMGSGRDAAPGGGRCA
jgi:lipopolysaccharide/colanic/teichoic acid biosynthesis glycosyltransferase